MQFLPAYYAARLAALLAIGLSLGLSACGGGSANDPSGAGVVNGPATVTAAPSVDTPSARSDLRDALVIAEIGSNYYSDDVAWLEVHNRSGAPVSLAAYHLRSGYVVPASGVTGSAPVSFALPDVSVPAQGDLVIAGKVSDNLADGSQIVYVRNVGTNGNMVPFWNANGAVELVNGNKTADFVAFGNATATPLTAGAWAGPNVAALPSGPDQHGKSIVRLASAGLPDTDTAADWNLVNFATPGGPNDVPPGVVDSDQDGIPDSAKQAGAGYAGLDLWSMGARPGRRDVFLEIDSMQGSDPALTPRREALQKLVDAFAAKNIALHIDTGDLYSSAFDPAGFNLGGGNPVAFASCIALLDAGADLPAGCASFYAIKRANFDLRRRLVFHYALFASSQNTDGSAGSSGIAELLGNDLIVSLGGYGFNTHGSSSLNLLINLQASTLMHELGHNFGLRHGGNEDVNYKPNQLSVMNYMYQFAGLTATPDNASAAQRYYLANGLKGQSYCNLSDNSPCGSDFVIGYSDGSGADLDETALSEAANIGHGSSAGAYADWDNSYSLTGGTMARNINPQYGTAKSVLKDYDEWDHLKLSFAGAYGGSNSGSALSPSTAARQSDPMSEVGHRPVVEEVLPAALQTTLHQLAPHYRDDDEEHDDDGHERD